MSLYRNAFYWFIALLVITVAGFWGNYFAKLGHGVHLAHHFHAVAMVLWILLLIAQSWLIRNRRRSHHRALGKVSFLLAPAVVISALVVTFYSQIHAKDPLASFTQSLFWFGFFTAALFTLLYILAIRHRRNMQLHARYMVATGPVFLVPGLTRVIFQYIAPTGIWVPSFFQILGIPLLIGLWLMFLDWRKDQDIRPFLMFNVLWAMSMVVWVVIPSWSWWNTFSAWAATI